MEFKISTKIISLMLSMLMVFMAFPAGAFAIGGEIALSEETSTDDALADVGIATDLSEETAVSVLFEMEELRESDKKQFRMSDGSYTTVTYMSDVHFADGEEWVEIDNTLTQNESGIVNTASDVEYIFSDDVNTLPGVTASRGEYQVTMSGVAVENNEEQTPIVFSAAPSAGDSNGEFEISIINPQSDAMLLTVEDDEEEIYTLEKAADVDTWSSAVLYDAIGGGDSYHYELNGRNLKESIVVYDYRDSYVYAFRLEAGGLSVALNDDGDITICDGDEQVFVIPAPYMIDAMGAISYNAAYTLEAEGNGNWFITLTADSAWINADDRTFPVVIDPSLYVPEIEDSGDGMTIEYITVNNNSVTETNSGYELYGVGKSAVGDLYSHLKVTNLPVLPYNTRFCKAWFYIPYTDYAQSDLESFNVIAQPALNDWKTQFTGTANNGNILDYKVLKPENAGSYITLEVTEETRKWYDDSTSNKGIVLYAEQTNGQKMTDAARSVATFVGNYKTDGVTSDCTYFAVEFRNVQGIESSLSYDTADAARAGTVSVSDYTGSMTLVHTDVADSGYTLSHVYNSNYADRLFTKSTGNSAVIFHTVDYSNMLIGKGWKLSAQESVVTYDYTDNKGNADKYLIYTDGDGSEHYFAAELGDDGNKTGTYLDEEGLGLKIVENSAKNGWIMSDEKDNEKLFIHGYLTKITDSNGNVTAFLYNGDSYSASGTGWYPDANGNQLTSIVRHNNGMSYYTVATLTYNGSNLVKTTDRYGNETVFTLSDGPQIDMITEPDGQIMHYFYGEGNYRMSRAYDAESNIGLQFDFRDGSPDLVSMRRYSAQSRDGEKTYQYIRYFNMTIEGQSRVRDCGLDNTPYTADDILYTYTFDDYGRTVSINGVDARGNTVYTAGGTYSANSGTKKTNNRLLTEGAAGVIAQNILKNGGAESGEGWNNFGTELGVYSNGCEERDEFVKSGKKSFGINLESGNDSTIYQDVTINSAGKYIVTAHVKTASNFTPGTGAYAGVRLQVEQNLTPITPIRQDRINERTDENINDGWLKVSTVVNIPSAGDYTVRLVMAHCTGTAYFDEIQMIPGESESAFNHVDNSSFTYPITLPEHGTIIDDNDANNDGDYTVNDVRKNVLKLEGRPYYNSEYAIPLSITLTEEEAANTTFLFSGWARANSVPITVDRTFQITTKLTYSDGTYQYEIAKFNPDVKDMWQYICIPVVPKKKMAITDITVYCSFKANYGYAYFDDLALVKEACSVYEYDKNGRLKAVNATNQDEMQFGYEGANLISSAGGANGSFEYTYDDNNNIIKATNENLSMDMVYNSAGQTTSTTLKGTAKTGDTTDDKDIYLKTEAEYSADGSKVKESTDELGNTTEFGYQSLNNGGQRVSTTTDVSDTVEYYDTTDPVVVDGYFTDYCSSGYFYSEALADAEGWDVYTEWSNDGFVYVRFENDAITTTGDCYFDWYFYNNGIQYRMYARGNGAYALNWEHYYGLPSDNSSHDKGASQCYVSVSGGFAEFKIDTSAVAGISDRDQFFISRAYVWGTDWVARDQGVFGVYTEKGRDYSNTTAGKVTINTQTDASGRTDLTYINNVASVDYSYTNGNLTGIVRGGYNPSATGVKDGTYTDYNDDDLVYSGNGWTVHVKSDNDYAYVRFDTGHLISNEQRIFDWYFDNDGVSYRIYSQWTRENPFSFYMFYGNGQTGQSYDRGTTTYCFDTINGVAEYKIDLDSVGAISENDGFTLNRAYVWDSTWTKQDECTFDISVGIDYNDTVTDPGKKQQSYSFEYDIFGNVTATTVGSRVISENTYNNYGTLASVEYGNGEYIEYTYDELDRLRTIVDSNWTQSYTYDGNGNVTRIDAVSFDETEKRTIRYEYDSIGRLVYSLETDGDGQTLRFVKNQYDNKNRLTEYSYYDGLSVRTESYTYNDNGTVKTFAVSNGDTITNDYDTLNRIQEKTVTNSDTQEQFKIITNYKTDSTTKRTTSLITDIKYDYPDNGGTNWDYRYFYEYDNLGNITHVYYRTATNSNTYTDHTVAKYAYDEQSQLILEEVHDGDTTYTLRYIYDTYGNIRKIEKYQGAYSDYEEVLGYGILLDTVEYGYDDDTWLDLLTSYDGNAITYDDMGNPVIYRNGDDVIDCHYMSWIGRQLVRVGFGGDEVTYEYDAEGQRTEKTVNGQTHEYLYYGSQLNAYTAGSGETFRFFYDDAGEPLGFYFLNVDTQFTDAELGAKYYYVRNAQGDIVQIRDSEYGVVANYHYDAWGKLLSITDAQGDRLTDEEPVAVLNPLRYRGYVYDTETGFYYLNSRYYDPEVKRFISADTTDILTASPTALTDKNLYAYCDNNPIMRADNGGEFWNIIAGAVIGGGLELAGQLLSGKSITDVNWAKVGVSAVSGGVTAAVGPVLGATISGATNIALDVIDGERDIKKLAVSGAIGVGASLVGAGVGKVVEKAGGKAATRALSKMPKAKLKAKVTSLVPTIKSTERNAIKNISYLISKYKDIGSKFFMSTEVGKTLVTSTGQFAEGFTGGGLNYVRNRNFPSW